MIFRSNFGLPKVIIMKPILLYFSLFCLIPLSAVVAEKPPNILILYADDWRHDTLGVAGNTVVKTPVLDALSSKSVRFTHNCVTTSICGVSRASLFTGQWMSRHGCDRFKAYDTPWSETYPGV